MKPNPKEDDPFKGRVPKTFAQMTPAERRASEEWRIKCAQADKIPSKLSKRLAWGSWAGVLLAAGWLALYEDWGPRENVFTDLRKHYQQFMKETFNLSPQERSILGRSERAAPVKVQGKVIYPSKSDRENAGLLTNDEISELEKKYGLRTNDGKPS